MKRKELLSWGIVGLLSLGLRFADYGNRWVLNQDQARDAVIGLYAWKNGLWPQIGSPSSAGPFNFGPWYHWIIMFFEKILPVAMGPWIAFTLLTVVSVFLYAAIGKKYYGNKGIIIFGLMAAVAVGQVENAADMLNTVIVGFFSAVAWWATMKLLTEEKLKWAILTGVSVGLAINSHFQAWGLMGLLLAIFLVNKFLLIKRIRWGIALGLGWLISFLPLLRFDISHNWVWIKSVVEYYTVGVKKFYVPVRWLTEIRDFWPQLFGSVTVGINWFGYIWLVLGIIIVVMMIKKKKKINRFWWVLVISLLIQVGLMRMYKGVRSREYLIAFHGYIILASSWIMAEFYQWKKYLVIIVIGAILMTAGYMDIKIIKERKSQAKEILKINEEIKGKVEIYNYKESNMVAMPIFYLRYWENQMGKENKIGFCDNSRYQCPMGAKKIYGKYQIYELKGESEGFEKITGENTFNSLMVNYGQAK